MAPSGRRRHRLTSSFIAAAVGVGLFAADHPLSIPPGNVKIGGHGRLIAYEPLPEPTGEACLMPAAVQRAARASAAASRPLGSTQTGGAMNPAITPVRKIQDPYPAFAAIAVDPERNEVVVTDENLFQILVYDRLENTPAAADASRPKRVIAGDQTEIEFQSGLYSDPRTGDIYAPNNDTVNLLVVFSKDAAGNAKPQRALRTPHGTFGIAVDERRQEMLLTTQHDSTVVVFRKGAGGDEAPVRLLQGDRTGLADPHGIAIDPVNDIFFVANYGSRHAVDPTRRPREGTGLPGRGIVRANWPVGWERAIPGSGRIAPPSITVHALTASGDTPPLRVIQGPRTQLNWPTGLAFDPARRELFVANDMGPSILVFDANASGDVAPKRVLKGSRTRLANPTAVALDLENRELWVANFGGHSATAYPLDAQGDTPPRRIIRSGPESAPSLMIGNPGAVAYDSKRGQLLVPN